jgi:hypothetical protein
MQEAIQQCDDAGGIGKDLVPLFKRSKRSVRCKDYGLTLVTAIDDLIEQVGGPRKDGGKRAVSVFQVSDNAISRLIYERLLDKNARHFSAHAYAYRKDLTIHGVTRLL